MDTAIDIIEECFKSNQGVKARLKQPRFVRKVEIKMAKAQIELLNMHLSQKVMNPTERRRAEQVLAGIYDGRPV